MQGIILLALMLMLAGCASKNKKNNKVDNRSPSSTAQPGDMFGRF